MNLAYKKNIIGVLIFLVFGLALFPGTLFASSAYFDSHSQNIYPGDVFVVEARISSLGTPINVADATILFDPQKATVKEVSTGGSVFTLWAQSPSFSNNDGTIRFVGGVPDGFTKENGLILKIVFSAINEGEFLVDFSNDSAVFLSDGKGTKAPLTSNPAILSIAKRPAQIPPKDEWQDFVGKDTTSPLFVESLISKDSRVFDGKYFVSFFAVDEESGIAYYEIKEGERGFVRAESPHILTDQTLKEAIRIKAVDTAGNEAIVTPGRAAAVPFVKYLVGLLFLSVILTIFFWVRRFFGAKAKRGKK